MKTSSPNTTIINCPQCKGSGVQRSEERGPHRVDIECICSLRHRKSVFLGPDIFAARKIQASPLHARTMANLVITSPWSDLLPHLRLAVGMAWHVGEIAGDTFTFHITTDEQVLRASLGRDKDPDPYEAAVGVASLVIVRLGFLGWRNAAAAGFLHEALRRCEFDHRPVWLTDTPSVPFVKGHLSWSPEVDSYIAANFERLDL